MSLSIAGKNATTIEIVRLIDEFPETFRQQLFYILKMKKTISMAKEIDKQKRPSIKITDEEIADIVHDFRKAKK